jgi:thymidylate kinase
LQTPLHKIGDMRESFLNDFQHFLKGKSYAALKFYLPEFSNLPLSSDLDLVIAQSELKEIESFVESHLLVNHSEKINKSFMNTIKIHFNDSSFLSIDLINDFIRKGRRYLSASTVLENATEENNVVRPSILDDIQYAQHFYTLNTSAIPEKYMTIFKEKLEIKNKTEIYLNSFNRRYHSNFKSVMETFSFSINKKKMIKRYIKSKFNQSYLVQCIKYLKDLIIDLQKNKGFIVTFSGVDGAGKTTIIDIVKKQFEQKYRKEVILLRHRPGILPIISSIKYGGSKNAELEASKRLPRQGTNNNKLSSLIRFSYYFIDYIFGQIYIYFKYILRGKIIIYDRYYYDFINDSKRSNITLERTFIKSLFKFIYKPKFNFYLYNDPEVILRRKQELKKKDIIALNEKYKSLFNEYNFNQKGAYIQIKNDKKSITIAEIFHTINKVA